MNLLFALSVLTFMNTNTDTTVVDVYRSTNKSYKKDFYLIMKTQDNDTTITLLGWETTNRADTISFNSANPGTNKHIVNREDTIYYKAETKNCVIRNNEVSFSFWEGDQLNGFVFVRKPFTITSLNDFEEYDAGFNNRPFSYEVYHSFRGTIENNQLRLIGVKLLYDSRADNFVFEKIKQ